jgi:hypothetical protein
MIRSVLVFALIIGVLAAGAVVAQAAAIQSGNLPACAPATPQTSQVSNMPDQRQAITVDENYVYVLRDNQVLKLRKSDLSLVARADIYGMAQPSGVGRGPVETKPGKTPLYPSGSWTDMYTPSGAPGTVVDRSSDYENY